MNPNYENEIMNHYKRLCEGVEYAGEVYAGEEAGALAQEKGIPNEVWGDHRVRISLGQAYFHEKLKDIPVDSGEERKKWICDMIGEMVDAALCKWEGKDEKRAYMIQVLAKSDDDEVFRENLVYECRNNPSLEELKDMTVNKLYERALNTVWLDLTLSCDNAASDAKQENAALTNPNPGALAVSEYMATPALQNEPEVFGIVSAAVCNYAGIGLENLGFVLLAASVCAACVGLLAAGSAAIGAIAANVLVDHTLAGVGTAIAAELSLHSGLLIGATKLALGTGVIGGLATVLGGLLVEHSSPDETYNESGIEVSYDNSEDVGGHFV